MLMGRRFGMRSIGKEPAAGGVDNDTRLDGSAEEHFHTPLAREIFTTDDKTAGGVVMDEPDLFRFQLTES